MALNPSPEPLSVGVVVLAAGASSRMGRPKLLLPWGETTVIGHLIVCWQTVGGRQIAVVSAVADDALRRELARLKFSEENCIPNPAPELGMFHSVQCAARWPGWQAGLTHHIIALGDQPHLQSDTLLALIRMARKHPGMVCQLSRQGRPRHPVMLPEKVFREVAHSTHGSLKEFLQGHASSTVLQESDDAGLDLDIDHPADYERAMRLFVPREVVTG